MNGQCVCVRSQTTPRRVRPWHASGSTQGTYFTTGGVTLLPLLPSLSTNSYSRSGAKQWRRWVHTNSKKGRAHVQVATAAPAHPAQDTGTAVVQMVVAFGEIVN